MPDSFLRNRILALLSNADRDQLAQHADRVRMLPREVICRQDAALEHVYFPIDGVISAVLEMESGAAIEAIPIGSEGMVGIGLLAEQPRSEYTLIQQIDGESIRIPVEPFRTLLEGSIAARRVLERYLFVLQRYSAQNAACNLHHAVEGRICRWLLSCADHVGGSDFYITQELLGEMLGVRRQSVNATATRLQQAGLIRYRRGNLAILDRPGLESATCACYQITKSFYERVMGVPWQEAPSHNDGR